MTYSKAVLNDGTVIFADDNKELLGLSIRNEARILYADPSPALVKLSEKEAELAGKNLITFDFSNRYMDTASFFTDLGFDISETNNILSVNAKELFASKGVQKSIRIKFPGTSFIPIREMLFFQLEELLSAANNTGMQLTREDIVRFDEDLSGTAYHEHGRIMSFILVCDQGKELVIECLYGVKKNDSKYILTSLCGFALELLRCDLLDVYDRITMLEMRKSVGPLLRGLLDNRFMVDDSGKIIHAEKNVRSLPNDELPQVRQATASEALDMRKALEEKLHFRYYQDNINWKTGWSNNHEG